MNSTNVKRLKTNAEAAEKLAIEARRQYLAAQYEEHAAKVATMRPEEPKRSRAVSGEPMATIVFFKKRFGGDILYEYVAIRPSTRAIWTVANNRNIGPMNWERLLDFIVKDEKHHARQGLMDSMKFMDVI